MTGGRLRKGKCVNDGGYVSRTGIISGVLWVVVTGLLGGAWAVVLLVGDHLPIAGMLAATGCALSALAATLQIKTYACGVSRLVRATSGASVREEVRPLR